MSDEDEETSTLRVLMEIYNVLVLPAPNRGVQLYDIQSDADDYDWEDEY